MSPREFAEASLFGVSQAKLHTWDLNGKEPNRAELDIIAQWVVLNNLDPMDSDAWTLGLERCTEVGLIRAPEPVAVEPEPIEVPPRPGTREYEKYERAVWLKERKKEKWDFINDPANLPEFQEVFKLAMAEIESRGSMKLQEADRNSLLEYWTSMDAPFSVGSLVRAATVLWPLRMRRC